MELNWIKSAETAQAMKNKQECCECSTKSGSQIKQLQSHQSMKANMQ